MGVPEGWWAEGHGGYLVWVRGVVMRMRRRCGDAMQCDVWLALGICAVRRW